MKNISSQDLRELRNKFWESKQHKYIPEASLIASWKESTALFNVAWMQQLIPYLMWKAHPLGKRVFNIQKCVRTVDIEEVWDASHLTFFEMMGNWSLWDYFKNEAVTWSREFLTSPDYLWLDPRKLAVTVFAWDESAPRDETTANKWQEVWLPAERISYLPADNNRWSPGPVGPCGPDTEIFYRVGESEFPAEWSNVWNDEDNWMEIWNNVFMEFYRDESWTLSKLNNHNVDTGMWFERMCCVMQQKESVYDTDVFSASLKKLEELTGIKYEQQTRRFRIIADHIRTAFMLINDWLIPSNVWAGYVLRMIIRRFYYNLILLKKLNSDEIGKFIDEFFVAFKWLREFDEPRIKKTLIDEISQFEKTIHKWEWILQDLLSKIVDKWTVAKIKHSDKVNRIHDKIESKKEELHNKIVQHAANKLSWDQIFMLYDTYGFPLEITKEIAAAKWVELDIEWYQKALEQAKEKSRQSTKEMFKKWIDRSKYLEWIPQTKFIGYKKFETSDVKLLKDFDVNWQRVLIFDKTPFYPEMWGQMWDKWTIELDDWSIVRVINVQTFAGVILHIIE